MADPTPDEVRAALAILAAAETAREAEQVSTAESVEHSEPAAPTATPREPAVDVAPVMTSAEAYIFAKAQGLSELTTAVEFASYDTSGSDHEQFASARAAVEKLFDAARKVGTI